jgi:hypothetical protein
MSYAISPLVDMLSISRGIVPGVSHVNKYGRATNADNGVATDVWDHATQSIWLAPTAARIHSIASANDNDGKTGAPASSGARTLRIWGLKTWDTAETSEDITLDGTTGVNTANSYVIIHRMAVLTSGASGPNIGLITATAATDGTITAQIAATNGQTLMAIYGVPSTQTAYLTAFYALVGRVSPSGVDVDVSLLYSFDVENQPAAFLLKFPAALERDGLPYLNHHFIPYYKFEGPGILKLQVNANANDTYTDGGFGLILVNN